MAGARYSGTGLREVRVSLLVSASSVGPPFAGPPSAGPLSAGLPSSGLPSSGLPSSGLPSSGLPSSGLPEVASGPTGAGGRGAEQHPADRLATMLRRGELELPLPGHGATGLRWARLAAWGRESLPLARLAEGHTDAVAVLREAGVEPVPGARYGVWAARSGGTGAELTGSAGAWVLRGRVRFCSGAPDLERALVVAAAPGGSRIVDLDLSRAGIRRHADSWRAAGMRASDTLDVDLDDLPVADVIGVPGFYTGRPGFWWGGAGVAAVWLGGAAGIVDALRDRLREQADPHQLALFGELHAGLEAVDALLGRTADAIDADPASAHRTAAWTARAAAERLCRTVLDVAPRVAGVAALAGGLADELADLGMYVRQHHGERDLAALGEAVLGEAVPGEAVPAEPVPGEAVPGRAVAGEER
ncbi:acyl-CoA dehydrogenase [Pseudonocardia sp. RS010]|uniref:acyl-CoA dehydrogenase n=1 Tax=Pseudonocardia sp. RS010 TaxID=3385979 RepID=UPI0039A26053